MLISRKHPSRDVMLSGQNLPKKPRTIISCDVLGPLKQALWVSRDVNMRGPICGSKSQTVFTLGDGCVALCHLYQAEAFRELQSRRPANELDCFYSQMLFPYRTPCSRPHPTPRPTAQDSPESGKKKEHKPKLLGPDLFRLGVFDVKGWGAKSSVSPSKPRETRLLGGISRGARRV